ncbi:MBL fold metallo-hydrolase [Spirosoma flavum]|uniref:MBL fold metallo-hydrolase n=1 Tax=Spirosoma flavum TaxID=2048557 RepID=A0ABW6ASR4_9BACT
MATTLQITPRLWQLKLGVVNSFLLETEDGLFLIDTGYPNSADKLFAAVRETGHDPAHIRHLLLTHCHIDHAGSAAEVHRRTGARTYAHTLDATLISQGIGERPNTAVAPGLIPALVYKFFIKNGGTSYEPLPIDQTLHHGELLPLAGGIEIIHTPGHSAGHIALLLRQEGVLVAADLCSHVLGLGYSTVNEDIAVARQSILRAADYPFEQAVFGHGNPLLKQANQQLRTKFSGTQA